MATIAVSDVLPTIRDYVRNQNLTDARGIRAINSAVRYVASQIGLPGQEKEYSFNFFEDQPTYSLPSDFGEPLSLRFQDDQLNQGMRFSYKLPEWLFERVNSVQSMTSLWGIYQATGTWTAYILALNSVASIDIDTFDANNSTNWSVGSDATNIQDDQVTKKEGQASLKFDINTALSVDNRASLTRTFSNGYDLTTMNNLGHGKIWAYLATVTNLTSASLSWGTDSSNYYKVTVTTQVDGSALAVGWNQLDFAWNGASTVGSPTVTNIAYFKLDLDYTGSLISTNGFRYDFLRFELPDTMIMTYYTTNIGTTSGGTALETFTATTDLFSFGSFDPSLLELIALQAAILIDPTFLIDNTEARRAYDSYLTTFKRRYPKKKTNNLIADPQVARTSR